jgi:glutaredoxin
LSGASKYGMLKVYSRKNCERCARVKKELAQRGHDFLEVVIGEDIDRDTVMGMFPGVTNLPILAQSGRVVDIKDL